jgi:hypothetical protein
MKHVLDIHHMAYLPRFRKKRGTVCCLLKSTCCFMVLLFVCMSGKAQNPLLTGLSSQYGFIIPHSKELIDVSRSRPIGVEGLLGWQLPATAESGMVSRRGFKVSFIDFNNPKVLGYSVNLAAFAEPLVAPHHKVFASVPLEFGLSYNNKIYDEVNNPSNLFFSQGLNFYLSAGVRVNWRISPRFIAQLSAQYQHISNGGMKQPNKGMNFPMAALGLMYYLQEPSWKPQERSVVALVHPGVTMNVLLLGSVKTIELPEEKTMLWGYQYTVVKRIKRIHGVVAGLEGLWNGYKKEYYERKGEDVIAYEQSVQLGYEMKLSKTSFQVLIGCDVYNENRSTDLLYQRYGLYYQLLPHLKIGGTIKSHRQVADVIDVRLGYTFKTR